MSIQYTVLGFEPMTSRHESLSHHHQTRAPALFLNLYLHVQDRRRPVREQKFVNSNQEAREKILQKESKKNAPWTVKYCRVQNPAKSKKSQRVPNFLIFNTIQSFVSKDLVTIQLPNRSDYVITPPNSVKSQKFAKVY